jgi:hypothetical protein
VTILQHHLAEDGALGWTEGEVSEPSEPRQPPPREQQVRPQDPDKIIVYSYFPSSFWLIKLVSRRFGCHRFDSQWTDEEQVLESNGINLVTMHGGMSQKKRVDVLNSFRYCDRNGARVLLISNVGSVGLNIACANILIIVVRTYNLWTSSPDTTTDVLLLGRAVVGAERAAAHWTCLEISAAKKGPHLSPDWS